MDRTEKQALAGEVGRYQTQIALRDAAEATETTHDLFQRFTNMQLHVAVVRIGCDLGLFRILSESDNPLHVDQLAQQTGAAPSLLRRLLRYMGAMREVKETGQDVFEANGLTHSLADPTMQDCMYFVFDVAGPAYRALPETLKEDGYTDAGKALAFHRGHNTDLNFFPWAKARPQELKWFQSAMSIPRDGDWLDVFSVPSLASSVSHDQVLFVDVGGSRGHQCARIRARYPDLLGRIIVQDLPETIQNAPTIPGVEFMVHDFFTPQPVKGAKAYYLRTVLHDWDGDQSVAILKNLIPAMSKESLIIIDDMALPDTGIYWGSACLDLKMLTMLGAQERTESQWRALICRARLELVDILHYHKVLKYSIIVAQLPEL